MHSLALPPKKSRDEVLQVIHVHNVVIVGANGSGKTRFGAFIEDKNFHRVHRISAQKSLSMPESSHSASIEEAEKAFKFGAYHPSTTDEAYFINWKNFKYRDKPITGMLNDFDKLLTLLFTEDYNHALKIKQGQDQETLSKLDRIKILWEKVLPHRKLIIEAGQIFTHPNEERFKYNASEMSDGERVIFYLIGEVLCAKKNSILIIDEPEMHIHQSIINQFYDLLEMERPDCSFIYLTHNIDFASQRTQALKIWTKSYKSGIWDYEILPDDSPIPERLYLEILGSRKPILFIEGSEGSLDQRLYQIVLSDYTIKPLGSCEKVIHNTKAFKEQGEFHRLDVFGLIDRDAKHDHEIEELNKKDIWVLEYGEVENIFLVEDIIKAACSHMSKKDDDVLLQVKKNLFAFFEQQLETQKKIYFKKVLRQELFDLKSIDSGDIGGLRYNFEKKLQHIELDKMENDINIHYNNILEKKDYTQLLTFFNPKRKSLIANSNICSLLGLKRPQDYEDLVLNLLSKDMQDTGELCQSVLERISKVQN